MDGGSVLRFWREIAVGGGSWVLIQKFSASPKLNTIKRDVFGIETRIDVAIANSLLLRVWRSVCDQIWEQIVMWSENHELSSFKDVLSKHGLLTSVWGRHSGVCLVDGMFFLLTYYSWNRYLGQILTLMKSLAKLWSVLIGRGFHWRKCPFVWGAFVFKGQNAKDTGELARDATKLEVFPAFYFKVIASFLFQTIES